MSAFFGTTSGIIAVGVLLILLVACPPVGLLVLIALIITVSASASRVRKVHKAATTRPEPFRWHHPDQARYEELKRLGDESQARRAAAQIMPDGLRRDAPSSLD